MAESVVYSSVFGAVLASLRSVQTRLVVFDTEVVDLTDELDDPVDVLFGVQLGGGTDINRALAYCQGAHRAPGRHGVRADQRPVRGRHRRGDAAPGRGDRRLRRDGGRAARAERLRRARRTTSTTPPRSPAIGVPAFACTPDLFPDLMAAAIERRDLTQWAAANDIVTTHEPG